ncbi:lysoplasmalogenase [Caulobacter sp. BK020]|uniref:lysoplasmalogenase n=1 Tax=Caulobacter sp. BK020 TaxID=2512117 RepID=UPI0010444134|nr:lysoplasmalogenase [Caulobacter sp. BK020]TCS18110.1 putative membrane protein YhhN [Caulobacter sp. BK020]
MTDLRLWAVAGLCAALYGLVLVQRPPSPPRTLVKTLAVGVLSVLAYLEGDGPGLAIALALCALGDAFLAGDPKRGLPFGLAAFLAGHLVYVVLFWRERGPLGTAFWTVAPLVLLAAAVMLARLWTSLGALKPAVVVYGLAIAAMVSTSLLLPHLRWPATVGALAFMASDAILSFDLFKGAKLAGSPRLTAWAVWFLYFGGQAMITWGMLR